MDRSSFELRCRVLHTIAVLEAANALRAKTNTDTAERPLTPRSDTVSLPAGKPTPTSNTQPAAVHNAQDDLVTAGSANVAAASSSRIDTAIAPSTRRTREPLAAHVEASPAAALTVDESRTFDEQQDGRAQPRASSWQTDLDYMRAHRDALLHREHMLRAYVDAGMGAESPRSAPSSASMPHSAAPCASLSPPPPLVRLPRPEIANTHAWEAEPPPVHRRVRLRQSTVHAAAQPYRRVHCADRREHQLWLHMPGELTAPVSDDSPKPHPNQKSQLVRAPPDPFAVVSDHANERYARAYVRQAKRLQDLHPDLWSRALPSYAALDGTPQLLDNDYTQSFSRVRRVAQDDGISYVR